MEDFSEVSSMGKSPEQVLEDDFPIHVACKEGNLKFLEEVVLKATLQQMTQEDIVYGWQPIHWAAFHGQVDVLCGLIRGGIDKDIRTSRYQQAPAHLASFGGHKDTAQVLIEMHADVNSQDSLGETPLHKAARSGNVDMVITFMRGGADMSLCNKSGHTALDMARQHKFERCVTALSNPAMLLQANGAHVQTALVQNGSSGARMTNGNRHNNGHGDHHYQNGGNNGGGVEAPRKRNCDSVECEAMSRTKRMRTEGETVVVASARVVSANGEIVVHPQQSINNSPHSNVCTRVCYSNGYY